MKRIISIVAILLTVTLSAGNNFPYKKFLGLPANISTEIKDAFKTYLCSIDKSFIKVCECTKTCIRFRSCCMDYLWDSDRNETVEQYKSRLIEETLSNPETKCKSISIGLPKHYTSESILMRVSCPKNADITLSEACTKEDEPTDVRPVLGSDQLIYKNSFCALCNSVTSYELLQLEAEGCYPTADRSKSFTERYKGCNIKIKEMSKTIEEASIRKCYSGIVGERYLSPSVSLKDYQLCQSYRGGVYSSGGPISMCFRNPHCFQMSTGTTLTKGKWSVCGKTTLEVRIHDGQDSFTFGFTSTFSQLVSFNDLYKKDCDAGQVYDETFKKCISEISCGFGYELVNNECVKMPVFKRERTEPIGEDQIGLTQSEILDRCLSSHYLLVDKSVENLSDTIFKESTVVANTSNRLLLKINQTLFQTLHRYVEIHDGIQLIRSTVENHFITEFYGIDLQRTFPQNRLCAEPAVYKDVNFTLSSNCWLIQNDNSKTIQTEYTLNLYIDSKSSTSEIVKCKHYHLDNPCLKRTIRNYTSDSNGTVLDYSTDIVYTAENFIPFEDGLGVCVNTPKTENLRSWQLITNGVETYITVVGCFVSVICYVWVMLTYTIIPALKTIPGKNIVCLCSMLLCSDIIMLLSMLDVGYKACASFGIFLHYFALSTQIWAGIVAFDIWSTFHGRGGMRNVKSNKRFHIYLIVGYILPAAAVLVCIILEFASTMSFGYGLNGVCWITKFQPRLVAYIVPMVVVTVFNVTVLSYTIVCICKQSRKSKKLLKKTGGKDVSLARMALKLVILLGIVELFGLIQVPEATSENSQILNTVFRIIFSTARSFRGVFIWLLYIVTDRVFSVYKDIKSQKSLRTSTTRSTFASSRKGVSYRSEFNSSANEDQKLMQSV